MSLVRRPKILLIEDDRGVAQTVVEFLSEQSYQVLVCRSGSEGLSVFGSEHPDLVLLDLGLPDIDGIEVCYTLKHHPFAHYVPVLILTARTDRQNLLLAFENGADDYITKPIFFPELLARVRSHLRHKLLYEQVEHDRASLHQTLEFTGALLRSDPRQDIHQNILHQISMLFEAQRVSLLLPGDTGERLRVLSSTDSAAAGGLQLEMWKYPEVQRLLDTQEVVLVRDVGQDQLMRPVSHRLAGVDIRSVLAVPILEGDVVHTALLLRRSAAQGPFTERDLWLCRLIGDALGAMLRNHNLHKQLERHLRQLRQARDRLLKSERLSSLGQFVAGIARELNDPLLNILGSVKLLHKSQHSPFLRQNLARVVEETERCVRVAKNLLSFSQTHSVEKEAVDLSQLVDHFLIDWRDRLASSGIQLKTELEAGLPPAGANVHQLQQVLSNLFDNAVAALAHNTEPPVLSVVTRRTEEQRSELLIIDNGPGMRPEVQEHIFEPFFTTKAIGSGAGLGMTIVKGIVEEHGGTLEVTSEIGGGTQVLLRFPAAPQWLAETGGGESELAADEGARLKGHGRKILLVDDEKSILEALQSLLHRRGFEVTGVADGTCALEACQGSEFAAALVDWRLPDISGVELYERFFEVAPGLMRRCVWTSGDLFNQELTSFLGKTGAVFLPKPFTFDELLGRLAEVLEEEESPGLSPDESSGRFRADGSSSLTIER